MRKNQKKRVLPVRKSKTLSSV